MLLAIGEGAAYRDATRSANPHVEVPPLRPLRMALASVAIGAGGLAAFLIAQRALYGGLINDPGGWWTYLVLVGAGALTASVDRRPRSYFLAIGGTVVVSFAYLAWWALDPRAMRPGRPGCSSRRGWS
jgi:hypothetical protein